MGEVCGSARDAKFRLGPALSAIEFKKKSPDVQRNQLSFVPRASLRGASDLLLNLCSLENTCRRTLSIWS